MYKHRNIAKPNEIVYLSIASYNNDYSLWDYYGN
jgi:hypothetical protein